MSNLKLIPKKLSIAFFTLFFIFISSCSMLRNFGYKWADTYTYHKIDSYFDLTPQQKKIVSEDIKEFFKWHKSEELPRYEKELLLLEKKIKSGLTTSDIEKFRTSFKSVISVAGEKAASPAAKFLSSISGKQFEQMVRENRKALLKQEEVLQLSQKDQFSERRIKVEEQISYWMGPLTLQQKNTIENFIKNTDEIYKSRFDERKKRQLAFESLLKSKPTAQKIENGFREMSLQNSSTVYGSLYEFTEKYASEYATLIVELNKIISPKQKVNLSKEISSLIDDIRKMQR